MRTVLKIVMSVLMLTGAQHLYSALLIVKRVNNEFVPLDAADITQYGAAINNIVLKYEWPMCIASTLTKHEQHELLAPDKPRAEELFIQKKIQEVAGADYYVAFIPTVLYELYFMQQLAENNEAVIKRALAKTQYENRIPGSRAFEEVDLELYRIDLPGHVFNKLATWKLPNGEYDTAAIIREVYGVYQDANAPFFSPTDSAFLFFNTYLVNRLFELYPELQKSQTIELLSDAIERNTKNFMLHCAPSQDKEFKVGMAFVWKSGLLLRDFIKNKNRQDIVARVIDIEYEARSLNKGLILRATLLVSAQLKSDAARSTKYKKLLGSTLSENSKPIEQCREEKFNPYSSSFGVTLLAGIIHDSGASVMHILTKNTSDQSLGYAILIDKEAYYKNNFDNLFFIPPISPFAGILQQGEFFHARAKAASDSGWAAGFGLSARGVENDPVGFFATKRDPLRHAQLFSNYLAKNGRIIRVSKSPMDALGAGNEQEFMTAISKNQAEAAGFYGGVCAMRAALDKKVNRLRAKKMPVQSEQSSPTPAQTEQPFSSAPQNEQSNEQQSTGWGQWFASWMNWMQGNPE